MPKGYEPILNDEKKQVFTPDSEYEQRKRVIDYCPVCIEGGPYKLIYGKDEAGFPVKQCPECKEMYPIGTLGRIDTDITTSHKLRPDEKVFMGYKLTDLVKKKYKKDVFF